MVSQFGALPLIYASTDVVESNEKVTASVSALSNKRLNDVLSDRATSPKRAKSSPSSLLNGEVDDGRRLERARELTNLKSFETDEVVERFANQVDANGRITLESFVRCFEYIAEMREDQLTGNEEVELRALLVDIFEKFDDGSGEASFADLSSGLTVLCDGHG